MRLLLLSPLILAGVACTSAPVETQASAPTDSQAVCTKEPTLGSNRLQTVCRTPADIERDRSAAENAAASINRAQNSRAGG